MNLSNMDGFLIILVILVSIRQSVSDSPTGLPSISPTGTMTYNEYNTVTLTCTLTEDGNPPAMWSWMCNYQPMSQSQITTIQKGSRLTFTATKDRNGYQCYCRATSSNTSYDQISNAVTLNIQYAPTGVPSISPAGTMTYNEYNTVTLTCTLTEDGNPTAVWAWICNNQPMSQVQITSIQKGSRLTFTATKDRNGHRCYCRATSHVGSYNQTSPAVTLNIQYAPSQTASIYPTGNQTYNVTNKVALTCILKEDGNPPAVWSWICNKQPISQGQITTIQRGSILTFTATKYRNGHQCYCWARSSVGKYSPTSTAVSLNIQYAPTGEPSIYPSGTVTYNESNTVTLTCALTEDGNPPAVWAWICNNQPMSQVQIPTIQKGSRLTFTATKDRNGHRCYCRATSHVGSYNQTSPAVALNIQYAAKIQNITINGGSGDNIAENIQLSVHCKVDSNPPATTKIINMDNRTIFQTQNGVLTIPNSDCLDTATYKCETRNGHGIPDTKSFNIFVLCSPRQDTRKTLQTQNGVPLGGLFTLSAKFIAYPLPREEDIKWIFRSNEIYANSTIVDNRKDINITRTDLGKNVCNISLTRQLQSSKSDFGEYVAEVRNTLGREEIVYKVFPAGPPNPPEKMSLNCESPVKVIVSWISSFNGGAEQSFYVQYNIYNSTNIQEYPVEKKDAGEDKLMSHEITALKGNTVYSFAVFSNNSYGSSTPTVTVSCIVLGIESDYSIALIGAAAGAGIVAIGLIAVCILLYKKHSFTSNKEKSKRKRKSDLNAQVNDEDDGLRNNPLYGSSSPAMSLDPPFSSSEYASVVKPKRERSTSQDPQPLCTDVQKRYSKQKDQKNNHSMSNKDDGLKDNPLYGSSPPAIPLDPQPSSSEYSSVVRAKRERTNSQDPQPMYADVQKRNSKQKQKNKKNGHSKAYDDDGLKDNPLYGSSLPAILLNPQPSSSEYASVVKPRKEQTNSQDPHPLYAVVQKRNSEQKRN